MRIVRLMWSDEDLIRLRGKLTCLELDELVLRVKKCLCLMNTINKVTR